MGRLITLPLRLSARAASLVLRGTEAVLTRALALAGRQETAEPPPAGRPQTAEPPPAGRPATAEPAPPPIPASRPRPARRPARRPPPPVPARPSPPPVPDPAPPHAEPPAPPHPAAPAEPLVEQPTHISEEAEIVAELAEPGAEDGAGAQVTFDEPWEGYGQLNARDVIARLAVASQAELAAVTLYESAHQARQTVLSAAERQLALAARGGTSD